MFFDNLRGKNHEKIQELTIKQINRKKKKFKTNKSYFFSDIFFYYFEV